MSRSVTLIDCSSLIEHFSVIFSGWQITEIHENIENPILTVHAETGAYVITAEWLSEPQKYTDKANAICGFVARLVRAYISDDQNLLCLHGAAADFSSTLVVFPSVYRAGKSVLSACLASAGVKLFGDDVLPVSLEKGQCIAAGLALRLRIPLPENLDKKTIQFIKDRSVLKGKQYCYLDLRDGMLALKGSQADVGAFVLLEREESIEPVLEPVSKADILRRVVWQNFAREVEAPRILAQLEQMVEGAGRYRLRYDRPEDAVSLLKDRFENYSPKGQDRSPTSLLSNQGSLVLPIDVPEDCYLRMPEISEVMVDGEKFLADARGAAIHHLNPIGSAIWTLLCEPITIEKMVDLLLIAFPEGNRAEIEADVAALIKTLLSRKLVFEGINQKE